ncbi:MAG: AraC family transcriptional regulator [Candidatus Thiodiazotropha sp.]
MNTRDPSRACAHLSSLFRPHKLRLSRHNDDIRFTHNRIELDGLSINTLSYGKEITIDAPNNLADSYLVKFTLQGHSEVNQSHNSCTTQAGTICVLNPSMPLKDRMSEDFQMMIVQIQEKLLYAHLAKELGVEVNRPLDFQTVSVSMDTRAASFTRLTGLLCDDLSNQCSDFKHAHINKQLGQVLMSLLLMEIPHTYSNFLRQSTLTPAPYFVRLAEDYIHAHLCEQLLLDQLSAVAGVSGRSLQLAFKKHRGVSPMEYIRNCRLDRARELLQKRSASNITQIALDCGFNHLSKFSNYYKLRFGELPSDTWSGKHHLA